MTKDAKAYLQAARETLQEAEVLISDEPYPGAVSRAYYAIFYAASAMLFHLGLEFESHFGVKSKFGELLVKSGKVERRFGQILSDAYELRLGADYELDARSGISRAVAEGQFKVAKEFLGMAERFLKSEG